MATRKKSSKKYGKKAGSKVEAAMKEMKSGSLRSGRSKKKVKSRKQAIAIGLSEARSEGGKVPPSKKSGKKASSKAGSKASKKGSTKKGSSRKASSRKSSTRKSASK